jgi:hypothetical protein
MKQIEEVNQRCLVNIYRIEGSVSKGKGSTGPLIPAPKGQSGLFLAPSRKLSQWSRKRSHSAHKGRKEFLWLWEQTGSDLSQRLVLLSS